MPIDKATALAQIDAVIARHAALSGKWSAENIQEVTTLACAVIRRLSPPGSAYPDNVTDILANIKSNAVRNREHEIEYRLQGVLAALRADYDAGRLQSFQELVNADLFSDFLEMAEYLFDEGYKDPAAVITGSVLEEHLRKLCGKYGVVLPPKPKLDTMNADLVKSNAYGKNDQKQVTAWAGIRNDAAHGNYAGYTKEQVRLMIEGIRGFISRNPA